MEKSFNKAGLLIITGITILFITSCNFNKKYQKEEESKIQNYLLTHSTLSYEKKASGLYYLDDTVGTGVQPAIYDSVYVMYKGYYITEDKFATNVGTKDTLKFIAGIGEMISGFDEAIMYMKVGGKAKIVVPSYLAYGTTGLYMPAYTPLLFDIYLKRVKPHTSK
jgi:FKBP-type peptidyl-prolyl cis-trans isomerase